MNQRQPLENRGALALQIAGPFGPRLRMERERRRITLDSIAANTKIGVGLLKDLEQDNVSRWPAGIYRRSFIKAYAQAIGLDPEAVAREFLERFPDQETVEPLRENHPTVEPGSAPPSTGVRLTLVQPESTFTRGCLLRAARTRGAAVAWDVGVVLVIAMSLFVLLGHFWRPLGIFVLAYYTSGILLLGNTPGVCLFAAPRSSRRYGESAGTRLAGWASVKAAVLKARMMTRTLIESARRTRS
jgi:transcriptional regulator with XRE-family HTH domain